MKEIAAIHGALRVASVLALYARPTRRSRRALHAQATANTIINPNAYQDLRWRTVGPIAAADRPRPPACGTQPNVFYMGTTGGGVLKTDNYGITWIPVTDGQIPRDRSARSTCRTRIRTSSTSAPAAKRFASNVILGTRRLQVDRRRPDVDSGGAEGRRPDRPAQDPSEEPGHRLRRGARQSVRLGTRARRAIGRKTAARRGRRCSSSTIRPASSRSRSTGRIRTRCTRARGARSASRGRSSAAGRPAKAASTRPPTAAITGRASSNGFPDDLDRQGVGRRRAVESEGRLRAGRGGRREGRALPIGRQRRELDARQQQPVAARAAVLFQQGIRQPEGRERGVRHRALVPPVDRRRQDVRQRRTRRTATTMSSGSIPTTRRSSSRPTTAAPTSRRTAARAGRRLTTSRPPRCATSTRTSSSLSRLWAAAGHRQEHRACRSSRRRRGVPTTRGSCGCRRPDARAARCGRRRRERSSAATARASSGG